LDRAIRSAGRVDRVFRILDEVRSANSGGSVDEDGIAIPPGFNFHAVCDRDNAPAPSSRFTEIDARLDLLLHHLGDGAADGVALRTVVRSGLPAGGASSGLKLNTLRRERQP
jgi:hypothetical protein